MESGFGYTEITSTYFKFSFIDRVGKFRYAAELNSPFIINDSIFSSGDTISILAICSFSAIGLIGITAILGQTGVVVYAGKLFSSANSNQVVSVNDSKHSDFDLLGRDGMAELEFDTTHHGINLPNRARTSSSNSI